MLTPTDGPMTTAASRASAGESGGRISTRPPRGPHAADTGPPLADSRTHTDGSTPWPPMPAAQRAAATGWQPSRKLGQGAADQIWQDDRTFSVGRGPNRLTVRYEPQVRPKSAAPPSHT